MLKNIKILLFLDVSIRALQLMRRVIVQIGSGVVYKRMLYFTFTRAFVNIVIKECG